MQRLEDYLQQHNPIYMTFGYTVTDILLAILSIKNIWAIFLSNKSIIFLLRTKYQRWGTFVACDDSLSHDKIDYVLRSCCAHCGCLDKTYCWFVLTKLLVGLFSVNHAVVFSFLWCSCVLTAMLLELRWIRIIWIGFVRLSMIQIYLWKFELVCKVYTSST